MSDLETLIQDVARSVKLRESRSYIVAPGTRRLTKAAQKEYEALKAVAEAAEKLSQSCGDNFGTESADNGIHETFYDDKAKQTLDEALTALAARVKSWG